MRTLSNDEISVISGGNEEFFATVIPIYAFATACAGFLISCVFEFDKTNTAIVTVISGVIGGVVIASAAYGE